MKRTICNAVSGPGVLLLAMLFPAVAQTLEVYSEFQRVDPRGKVIQADRGSKPREILSPAVARNAHASFHLVVSVPAGRRFTLYIGQNPEDAVKVDLYREVYVQHGEEWIPDGLEPVTLPFTGVMAPDAAAAAFWLDMWVSGRSAPRRIKVEPQLYYEGRWIIYPMEVRIKAASVPVPVRQAGGAARAAERSDASVRDSLVRYLCAKGPAEPGPGAPTVRSLIARNAAQDMALAMKLEGQLGKEKVAGEILTRLGASDRAGWCAAPALPAQAGPEWYLRVRDFLFRAWD